MQEHGMFAGGQRDSPVLSPLSIEGAIFLDAHPSDSQEPIDRQSPVIQCVNSMFDLAQFKRPRRPHSLGVLPADVSGLLVQDLGAHKISDLPIKFPGSNFRIPGRYAQCVPLIHRIANFEQRLNPTCFDEYFCYLTFHQGWVEKGKRQRPSPCHVDGFQGARFRPKVRCNHSYVVSNAVPTVYHEQGFDLDHLDDAKHNFFWEMNRQVELAGGKHAWMPVDNELVLMDCYCVHRGGEAVERVWRTFVRVSFEVRIFDHVDNGKNPLFAYDWPLVDRHIEKLGLAIWQPGQST